MNKDSKKTKTSSLTFAGRERSSSTEEQNPVSAKAGLTRGTKRKARPNKTTPSKRLRVSEIPGTSENVDGRGVKRTVGKNREAPLRGKRRRLELESSSADTESCNISEMDVSRRGAKRKGAAAEGERQVKKTRTSQDTEKKTEEDKQETKQDTKEKTKEENKKEKRQNLSARARRAIFEAKYQEQDKLGQGGCGSVFAGYRKADNLPVAIKHIPKKSVFCKYMDENKQWMAAEVAIMLKLAARTNGSVGTPAPVSLLDWYNLGHELILVLERPIPSVDLHTYIEDNGDALPEQEAKILLKQLAEAAIELENESIFHRDIKAENILIETSSDVPRVRLIDFGLSCFFKKRSFYRIFYGTPAHVPPEWHIHSTYKAGPTTVWQVGVVLFEMLHRKASFETTKFCAKRLRISQKLTKDCRDFLRTCLHEDPEQRPTLEQILHHPWLR